ncbi:MAG TPA: MFS transporter [Arachnia sp.]|nr:MFS transporter [Arachnia sp.]HMT86397.1 MFS transporter [Arachnia sp.]
MGSYGSLLRRRGVARVLVSQLVARLPSGMISLGLLIHIEAIFGSYGAAGLVLGASSIGQAVSGPISARAMGRFGARPVLVVTTLVCAGALTAMALVSLPLWGFLLVGALCGLSYPPVQPAVRTIFPKLVDSSLLPRLFSLDASAQELIWVSGPVVITLLAGQLSSTVGLLVCAVLLVGGGAWFASAPELGRVEMVASRRRFGAVLLRPPVMLVTVVGLLLIAACAAVEASVVARFGEGGYRAGLVLAAFSAASLVGGLAFGHRPMRPWSLTLRMGIVVAGLAAALWESGAVVLSLALMIAGLGIAPALAVMFTIVAASVEFSESAEAYGWVGTGQLVGAAIGSAAAGFMIDASGHGGGMVVGAVAAGLGMLAAALGRRAQSPSKNLA